MNTADQHATTAGRGAMQRPKALFALLALASAALAACTTTVGPVAPSSKSTTQDPGMLVRLSELEIEPAFLSEYLSILQEEAAASTQLEPGVISIFPMQWQETPTQIRILEVYASRAAYEAHLQTPHFKHYKTATVHMVKFLRLVDMTALDPGTMRVIFRKLDP
jgi:quinol monooxygenase YgiN